MDLLTFELGKDSDELFIHGDPSGLRRLSKLLDSLAEAADRGEFPHAHLFAAEWGGEELSSKEQEEGHRCLPHVKVFGWPDSSGAKPYQPN
ncbi:Imm32 family immunity protein [Caenimonas koreensis]|uniref:Methylhydantoinase n=1 Tax=Caenimonas koreensis DSM 17982 TaxID=1121255 RepID=A0A844ARL3_9BURK|nr:Imm32 family immunity protein [Caenimonas koreensis]MRD46704.1 methylhydantoinase [Caenimonas koreensis DSM 17982]